MDKNLIILIFAILSSVVALGLGIAQYFVAKEDKRDADESKAKADTFQAKFEIITKEQKITLSELAEAYKKNAKQEEEFRKHMGATENFPRLLIRGIKREKVTSIGSAVEVQIDIQNESNYPLHNMTFTVEDILGFELYNTIRISRKANTYRFDSKPSKVDPQHYPSVVSESIGVIPKKSKPIAIHTTCYLLKSEPLSKGLNVHLSWVYGHIDYYISIDTEPENVNIHAKIYKDGQIVENQNEDFFKVNLVGF